MPSFSFNAEGKKIMERLINRSIYIYVSYFQIVAYEKKDRELFCKLRKVLIRQDGKIKEGSFI